MKPIVIKTHPVEKSNGNIFRLQSSAAAIIRMHQRASGLSACYIISEIIRKTADYVEFTEDGDVNLS